MAVVPSQDATVEPALAYRPCGVRLVDGHVQDRVYVQEARPWAEIWGVWPDEDSTKDEISIQHVVQISSSPERLSP